jgi:chitin synthase
VIDVVFGVVSFIFYTPTYLNILYTFALCRIDDISWGTKGLDAEVSKSNELKDSWKAIKIMHVAKYLFWNIVVGTTMLVISSPLGVGGVMDENQYQSQLVWSYLRKFYMTFGLMVIIGFALFLKIFIGFIYSLKYRCSKSTRVSAKAIRKNEGNLKGESKVQRYFEVVRPSMDEELEEYIGLMINDVRKTNKPIKAKNINAIAEVSTRRKNGKKRAEEKWKKNVERKSRIERKGDPEKKKITSREKDRSKEKDRERSREKEKVSRNH